MDVQTSIYSDKIHLRWDLLFFKPYPMPKYHYDLSDMQCWIETMRMIRVDQTSKGTVNCQYWIDLGNFISTFVLMTNSAMG